MIKPNNKTEALSVKTLTSINNTIHHSNATPTLQKSIYKVKAQENIIKKYFNPKIKSKYLNKT